MICAQRALGAEGPGEHLERLADRGVLLVGEPVVDPGPVAATVDDTGGPEDPEVTGCRRLVQIEGGLDVADAKLAM